MPKNLNSYELLVIGGSAGSFPTLLKLIKAMNTYFPWPVILVIHRGKHVDPKLLLDILKDCNPNLSIKEGEEKSCLSPNTLYVAPPDYHILVERDQSISLDVSEKVWYCRPSIDVLFQSAGEAYANKTVGILLSGANADGAEGLLSIRQNNGLTVIEDPKVAEHNTMPLAASNCGAAMHILDHDGLCALISQIIKQNEKK